ncbi:hypothetical protein [Paracoccus spongiarum]|uniref:Uncharacterized protein n=1 Tax=Paracoccus spongiarum TaxID=3064387 RepID=A0ABT9J9E8_9RHOB|nr:hypothetical protein [Paracoccus sp. 2205BS29-5]MDP5306434.1 hypothetical protein [Paracoccus sp. 2205BS29-5]
MRRAFVGFSTPVGFDYNAPDRDDAGPPPVLIGCTGLLILYDEIWFAHPVVCPRNMRDLEYVKFICDEFPGAQLNLDERVSCLLNDDEPPPRLDVLAENTTYDDFLTSFGGKGRYDYHSQHVDFLGESISAKPVVERLAADMIIIDHFDDFNDLQLDPCFNAITCNLCGPSPYQYLDSRNASIISDLAEKTLRLPNLYDIVGKDGPYHPVLEELRNHDFVEEFRSWAARQDTRLDNQTIAAIADELNGHTEEFDHRLRRAGISESSLRKVSVSYLLNQTLNLVPGAGTVHNLITFSEQRRRRREQRLFAFCAEAQTSVRNALRPSQRAP